MILPRPLPIRVHEVREHAPGVDIGIWLVDCHHELIVAPCGPEVALEDGHGLVHGGKSHFLLPKWLIPITALALPLEGIFLASVTETGPRTRATRHAGLVYNAELHPGDRGSVLRRQGWGKCERSGLRLGQIQAAPKWYCKNATNVVKF